MERVKDFAVDLFAENLPTTEEIQKLTELVHSSESNKLSFAEKVAENISKTSPKAALAAGIGLHILNRNKEAIEKLQKANDCKEKYLYMAFALRQIRKFEQSIECLQKSIQHGADKNAIALQKAFTYCCASNVEAAETELKGCAKSDGIQAEYHYHLGRVKEVQGFYNEAVENYKKTLEISPTHQQALFHLAYRYDLSGDEKAAIEFYKQIVSTHPVYVNALMNLAVLYEDSDEFDKAARCITKVLEAHPNHQRAILFKKDIDSSKTMYYDEEKEKKRSRKTQILETPISDFELSVRSRNCLKKMNIDTIGDLLNISEAELLSYKNFGETSLREIKAILEPRGMRLGMALDEKQIIAGEDPDFIVAEVENENQEILNKSIQELQLSVRAYKCLQKLNIHAIEDLTAKTEAELLGCKNFGVTSLIEIKKALSNFGLSLRNLD